MRHGHANAMGLTLLSLEPNPQVPVVCVHLIDLVLDEGQLDRCLVDLITSLGMRGRGGGAVKGTLARRAKMRAPASPATSSFGRAGW